MRGQQLREVLTDMRDVASASGGTKQSQALDELQAAFSVFDDLAVADVVAHVEAVVGALSQPAWEAKLAMLRQAELSEPSFVRALDGIANDKSLKKNDLVKIVEGYVGYADKKASNSKLIDALRVRFFGKMYDRDADEMAKRATPW